MPQKYTLVRKGFTPHHFNLKAYFRSKHSGNTLMKSGAGFTLIELLVVIAVIGILAAVGLVALNGSRERARDTRRISDLQAVRTGLALYFDTWGAFPHQDTFEAFRADATTTTLYVTLVAGKHISNLPVPPMPNEYFYYRSCSADLNYTLYAALEKPKTFSSAYWVISQSKSSSQEEVAVNCPQP